MGVSYERGTPVDLFGVPENAPGGNPTLLSETWEAERNTSLQMASGPPSMLHFGGRVGTVQCRQYRGTSRIRNCLLLGPYSRPMPRALRWSLARLRAHARCYWIHLPKRMESGSDPRSSCSDLVTRHVRDQLKIFKTLSAEKWLKSRPKSGLDCLIRAGFAKKQFFVGRRKLRPRCISETAWAGKIRRSSLNKTK